MGFREITLELSTDYTDEAARDTIAKQLGIRQFTWQAAARLPVVLVTHDQADIPAQADILNLGDAAVMRQA